MENVIENENTEVKRPKRSVFYVGSRIWDPGLGAKSKLIYAYLCRCANAAGECFPSVKNIAENCGVSKRTVQRAVKELEGFGALTVEERYLRCAGSRRRSSNLYRIPVRLPEKADETEEEASADEAQNEKENETIEFNESKIKDPTDAGAYRTPGLTDGTGISFMIGEDPALPEEKEELDRIMERLHIDEWEDESDARLLKLTIIEMWKRPYTAIRGEKIPCAEIRERLKLLNGAAVDAAFLALNKLEVANPAAYFKTCLYCAPAEEAGRTSAFKMMAKKHGFEDACIYSDHFYDLE